MPQHDAVSDRLPARRTGRRLRAHAGRLLQVVLTLGLLYWVFADPALLADMRRTLFAAEPLWLVAGVALGVVWIGAAVYRWHLFLRVQGIEIGLGRTGAVCLIGQFFALLLPGSVGGDAARIVLLCREHPHQKQGVVLSVIMDHLTGMIAMTATAAIIAFGRASWFTRSPLTEGAMLALLIFLLGAMLGLTLAFVGAETRFIYWIPNHVPGRERLIDFARAFGLFIRRWRVSLKGVAVSFVTLYGYFATFYCSARAFGAPVSLLDILSVMPVIDAVSALPLTVAGLGVREKVFETMMRALLQIPANVSLLISLGGFACSVFWSVVGAIVFAFYRPAGATVERKPHLGETLREVQEV